MLPPDRIAQQPLAQRDASRLMVLDRRAAAPLDHRMLDLPELLQEGDLLVVNRSRVLPARLLARRSSGAPAEILLVRQIDARCWDVLLRPGRRIRPGDTLDIAPGFQALVLDRQPATDGRRRVEFQVADGAWDAALARHGHMPLPPYIARPDEPLDTERYQVIYAREPGSVAAPTAGLHFTPALLEALGTRGIELAEIVLHVGPGTFRPVKVRDVAEHRVEPEPFEIPAETADAVARCRARGGRVVAVGTTSTRALESAADEHGRVAAGRSETSLVIVPGYPFRAVDALVTNFHLPRSSLLLLVAAFAGRERVLAAYEQAIRRGYRFYSYGDAMLLV